MALGRSAGHAAGLGAGRERAACAGLDLGGTKIEACLFDGAGSLLRARRIPTPERDAQALLDALAGAVAWLGEEAGSGAPAGPQELPIGIGVPGIVDPRDGHLLAANLPPGSERLGAALAACLGRPLPLINDAVAFACSEARGGAAEGARLALGLVLGSGVGAGLCLDGRPAPRHGGLAVEIGHVGLPAQALARHGLPIWPCGCGRAGCVDRYVSGRGLARIAQHRTGVATTGRAVAEALAAGEAEAEAAVEIWADLAGEALVMIQLLAAPDCIVLGGGLAGLPDCEQRLSDAFARHALAAVPRPPIRLARHPSSGARGAALLARERAC